MQTLLNFFSAECRHLHNTRVFAIESAPRRWLHIAEAIEKQSRSAAGAVTEEVDEQSTQRDSRAKITYKVERRKPCHSCIQCLGSGSLVVYVDHNRRGGTTSGSTSLVGATKGKLSAFCREKFKSVCILHLSLIHISEPTRPY